MKPKLFSSQRRSFLLASAAASTLLIPKITTAASSRYGIVGQKAPELKVSEWIDGTGKSTTFKLSDHKGKFVFMEFWQAWCPGCHSHGFPSLKKITDGLEGNDKFISIAIQTTFEGFSVNTSNQMRVIQERYDLPIIMGHDAGTEGSHPYTMKSYRSGGTPWAVLISPDGDVIFNDFSINPESVISFLKKSIQELS